MQWQVAATSRQTSITTVAVFFSQSESSSAEYFAAELQRILVMFRRSNTLPFILSTLFVLLAIGLAIV